MRFLIFVLLLPLNLVQCSKGNEQKDEYEIINRILKKHVNTYSVRIFPKKGYSEEKNRKHFNDSLLHTGKLTYYLYPSIDKLDTSNSRRTIIKDKKIDLSKIQSLEINRIDNIPCKDKMMDSCDPYFTAAYYFSEIKFTGNKALVMLNFQCGGRCGKGILIKLLKENNQWKIVKEDMVWIS
ncbi:hypothetical protein M2T82_13770 [Elizabethkingia ursingii]|uniref:hypothetical protein n=1 Tax=Elizabethkingia ursingii TaxID=1756150 RepID=UPI0020114B75|nr:hypothetical protein [Elizabethkingia ursingii]MCL1669133.1 hypothetical protein [Elizabethkingia ursingii]